MQTLLNQPTEKKNFNFVDVLRCVAMIFIVAEHCVAANGFSAQYDSKLYWPFLVLMQLTKFGTITFFLLAGFLLGDKFLDYSPGEYFKRRISNTFWPWLFWSFLYIVIDIILLYIRSELRHNNRFNWHNIFLSIKGLYLYSNYWFIINFMISIGILLSLRRYLYSRTFGIILGFFTLFYSVNIYFKWVPSNHTTAVLGFVFFIWVGAQLRANWSQIEALIQKSSLTVLLIITGVTFELAIYEVLSLHELGIESTNTLRITNIFYSFAVFCLLIRVRKYPFLGLLQPRKTTFGIYLIHFIIIVFILPLFFGHIKVHRLAPAGFIFLRFVNFLVAYGLTFFIVWLLNKSSARKLIGN